MRNIFKFLNFVLLLLTQSIWSQTPTVNVTVQVLPPYSTYLPDYVNSSNKVLLTLMSYTNASVKLKVTITGDNGITVATSDSYRPSTPLQLTAYQSKMLTGLDLRNYLEFNSVTVSGISKSDLFRGSGIPEGNYTLCVQVLDYNTGAILSSPEPLGCSNSFNIEQITPPQLITPRCDEPIMAGNVQNVIFSWLPPPGVPPGSQYKLKIVELIPATRNPNEAMSSATTPAFFETVTNTYSFVYGPAQPQLRKGRKYAWRVTLLPAGVRGGTTLNTQNRGNSEACSFEYKANEPVVTAESQTPVAVMKPIYPINHQQVSSGFGFDFSWTASKNTNVKSYQVQTTDQINEKKTIKEWEEVSEDLFIDQYNYYPLDAKLNLSVKMDGKWAAKKGKNAWRVVALDANKKIIEKSKVETFEIVNAPVSERIKLISPVNGKQIFGGENMTYAWTASKNKTVQEYIIQWKYIKNKNEVSEKLFSNTDFNGSIGPFKETSFSFTTQVDQDKNLMAWRVLGICNGLMVDSSLPDYVEFDKDTSELANLKSLIVNGYTIQINKIYSKDQDKFSASGKLLLWEGGKEVLCSFKDLKVRPVAYFPKIQKYQWAAIEGTIEINTKGMFPSNRIDLSTNKDCEGAFQLALNSMKLSAKLEGSMDSGNKLFKVTKDAGSTEGKVAMKWFSNWFVWQPGSSSSSEQYEFETATDGTLAMSFKDKFDGSVVMKTKNMQNLENSGIAVEFDYMGGIKVNVKKLEASTSLSGMVLIPNASPNGADYNNFIKLGIPFKAQKNLNFHYTFTAPLKWKINEDGSIWAKVKETYVHLSDDGQLESKFEGYDNGLNFDSFGVEVNLPQKPGQTKKSTLDVYFDKVYNKGKGYTTNTKPGVETKNMADIAGFKSKLNKSSFMIVKNKLVFLNIEGKLFAPFVNDWAGLMINADNKKIQEINLSFDYNKKYYLTKNNSESYAYVTLWSGRLEGNAIVVSPNLTIENSEDKGLEAKNMSMCDLYIDSSGAVSYNSNFADNSESVCEGTKRWANYYRFSYGIDKMKIKRSSVKTDAQFLFSGDLILGEKIGTTSKKEMGFVYHGEAPQPNVFDLTEDYNVNPNYSNPTNPNINSGANSPKGIFKGPGSETEHYVSALENSLEISDDGKAVNGGYEDGAQKFGGGFKIKTNDPVWGNYFELGGYYEAKEPDAKELQAKMILGKTLASEGKYTYWFFEFKQKGFVAVPIVPGILEAHGFGGKAYYHIRPTYNNMGQITDMAPDKAYSLGIAAEADVRTAYDQGATVHGHVQVVTQFKGWSIDGINYYLKGDAIAPNSNSAGLVQARLNGQLNWIDKYLDGTGQIWGGIKDIVCINEGAANEDAISFHFGADDFYLNVGSQEAPITAEVMCGGGFSTGIWLNFDTKRVAFGFNNHYDSGWKGLDLGVASAMGRLTADLGASLNVAYSPFQATGSAWFNGRAYGKGCVDFWAFDGCISGSCGVSANLTVSMPNPVVFDGSVVCDVHRWIPDFTLHARWSSNGGFSISL